jgi:hypothetical protein
MGRSSPAWSWTAQVDIDHARELLRVWFNLTHLAVSGELPAAPPEARPFSSPLVSRSLAR